MTGVELTLTNEGTVEVVVLVDDEVARIGFNLGSE